GGDAVLAHYQPDGTPDLRFSDFADGRSELYLADLRHGYRQLSHGALVNDALALSPDRHRLAYVSDRTGTRQLYVAAADGTQEQRLTGADPDDPAWLIGGPIWSPDGNQIAFTAAPTPCLLDTPCDPGTWIINADGSDPHQLTHGIGLLGWSPDGHRILLYDTPAERVLVANSDGGSRHVLANVNTAEAAWSPRGNEIALTVIHDHDRSIELVRPSGRLTASLGVGYHFAWAPNGRALLTTGEPSVPVFRPDGHRLTLIRNAFNPQWTANSRLAYENRSGVHLAT